MTIVTSLSCYCSHNDQTLQNAVLLQLSHVFDHKKAVPSSSTITFTHSHIHVHAPQPNAADCCTNHWTSTTNSHGQNHTTQHPVNISGSKPLCLDGLVSDGVEEDALAAGTLDLLHSRGSESVRLDSEAL